MAAAFPRARLIRLFACLVFSVALLAGRSSAQERFLGLKLASQEQLQGIPLASLPFSGTELPRAVDLSRDFPPPGQQGNQNSCVGWSLAYALKSYQEKLELKWSLTTAGGQPDVSRVFSPAFIYNQINNGRDGGAYIRDALNLLSERGVAPWSSMPYRVDDHRAQPSSAAVEQARRFRIDFWRRVNVAEPREVKAQLSAGYPVVIGANVDDGFIRQQWGDTWTTRGQPKGGHAMLVVGYDDGRGAFKVINSWGTDWGEGGYGWIGYRVFQEAVSEGYVVKDALNGDATDTPPVVNNDRPTPPTPPPVATDLAFRMERVQHNVPTAQGYYMTFEGTTRIPPGRGSWSQIVVYFHFDAGGGTKGQRVPAAVAQFADVYGYSATGTGGMWHPPEGVNARWTAYIPYSALRAGVGWVQLPDGRMHFQRGTVYLIAEAVLFIDNFGVANGGTVPFSVNY